MKILQVIPAFPPSTGYGGGPGVAYEISKNLVLKGHEVTVVTTDANDKISRISKKFNIIDGIKVHYFKNISNKLAYHHKIFLTPSLFSWARKEVKKFDIIHLHDTRTIQNIIVAHYARKNKIPYVIQPHGTISASSYQRKNQKKIFDFIFGSNLINGAKLVLALSEMESNQIKSIGIVQKKISIVPNGLDISQFQKLPKLGEFRNEFKINPENKIILHLGRIHKIKGIDLLIDAYFDLLKELPKTTLVIAGPDDGDLSNLKDKVTNLGIKENVIFTGPIYGNQKLAAYVDCNVYVLASIYEAFPISTLEALACNKPIVITNCSSISKSIDNIVGIMVEREKIHLKNAMVKILIDQKYTNSLLCNSRNFLKKFDWSLISADIEKIYLRIREGKN